jgi:acyl carrier protein
MEKEARLTEIKEELKVRLVEQLSLEDITADEIEDDAPLFDDGLGLDSLDAVEIVVVLQRGFNIEVKDMERSREVFASVSSLAEYVYQQQAGE